MMERWFFTMEGRNVVMRAQFESDDGTVGDARDVVEPGEIFLGLSYDELKNAAPGSLTVKDGMAVIDHAQPQEPWARTTRHGSTGVAREAKGRPEQAVWELSESGKKGRIGNGAAFLMSYVQGEDRGQAALLPAAIEDYVAADAPVRVIDAFVDGLDVRGLGFGRVCSATIWMRASRQSGWRGGVAACWWSSHWLLIIEGKKFFRRWLSLGVNQRRFFLSRARAVIQDRVFVRGRCAADSSRHSSRG
jgi:hypothetical protein